MKLERVDVRGRPKLGCGTDEKSNWKKLKVLVGSRNGGGKRGFQLGATSLYRGRIAPNVEGTAVGGKQIKRC